VCGGFRKGSCSADNLDRDGDPKKSRPDPDAGTLTMQRPVLAAGLVLLILIAAGAFGGVSLLGQISSLRAELANTRRELAGAKDRIARLERRLDTTAAPPSDSLQSRMRLNDGMRQEGPLELSREEIQLVRDYIKMPPAPPGAAATIAIGAAVPDAILLPLPQQISEKFPRLIGARFATDRNGAIVLVRRGSRLADAVIAPQQ